VITLSSDTRPIIGRGPPLGAAFFFLAVLSVVVMVLDHRSGYLQTARLWMSAAVNPIYTVVQAPSQFWDWLTESFADRSRLRTENERLDQQLRQTRTQLLRYEALNEENRRLREIREASQGVGERTLIAEIINVDITPFRHLVLINKGADDGVTRGQPVVDAFGVVGQVMQLGKSTATLILITDAEHAIPVQVNRNGIRSIAVGTGQYGKMSLPYMTVESDVRVGDLLVSSGLDQIFPAGYPVATVTKVETNPTETFALVEAKPLAQLDRAREVLLLWVDKPQREEPAAAKPVAAGTKVAPTTAQPAPNPPSAPPTEPESDSASPPPQ
jgi:rod shape-determining protein MreC